MVMPRKRHVSRNLKRIANVNLRQNRHASQEACEQKVYIHKNMISNEYDSLSIAAYFMMFLRKMCQPIPTTSV